MFEVWSAITIEISSKSDDSDYETNDVKYTPRRLWAENDSARAY